jgi:hypothetical protein
MKWSVQLNTAIPRILVTVALGWFGFLSGTRAVIPPPDGGYPGGNTAEAQNAFLALVEATSIQRLVSCRSEISPLRA